MSPPSSFSDDSDDAPRELVHAAAEWTVRRQQGLTLREQQEFQAWLAADSRHVDLYAEMRETSTALDRLHDPALAADPVSVAEHPRSTRAGWQRFALPMAAAMVIAAGAWGLKVSRARANYSESAATAVGGLHRLSLPDGSMVVLNTDSAVEVDYTRDARRIRLTRGEAFFIVAKNPERPFWVSAGGVSVRAVGTAFNVRFNPDAVEVLVKEGKVSVNPIAPAITRTPYTLATVLPPAEPQFVTAGELAKVQLDVDPTHRSGPVQVIPIPALRVESALAWQSRRLDFSDTPLSEVVAEFNRYNRHKLVIDDPRLAARTFGGVFSPEGYNSLVEALEQGFGVVAERQENATILRLPR
ncbi:MAG: anti-FecI sigma factor, FecR [Verrucomicrobia bacterium]|nr:anti-FecI sigma factor, FecR [Verrucomicrobiota bacterium]